MRLLWFIILFAPMAHAAPDIVAVEERGGTQMGEGSKWIARYFKDGCWQRELEGSNGAHQVRDSEAGCGAKSLAAFFEKLATVEFTPVVAKAPPSKTGGARSGPRVASELVFIDAAGKRWSAAGVTLSYDDLELPTWYAEPPKPPVGEGPQLIAFNVEGPSHVQATMTAGGTVWCHRSTEKLSPLVLPARPKLVTQAESAKLLAQFLPGLDAKSFDPDGKGELEAALPSVERSVVTKKSVTNGAVKRFVAAMIQRCYPCH